MQNEVRLLQNRFDYLYNDEETFFRYRFAIENDELGFSSSTSDFEIEIKDHSEPLSFLMQ